MGAAASGFLLLSLAFLLSPSDRAAWRGRLAALLGLSRGLLIRKPAEASP